jgi:hypothetical protein
VQAVFVIGVPRGGTTWVAQALSHCRGVTYVHEPDGAHDPFAFHTRRRDALEYYPLLRAGDEAPHYAELWAGVFAGGRPAKTLRDHLARRAYRGVSSDAKRRAHDGGSRTVRLAVADVLAQPRGAERGERGTIVLAKSVNAPLAAEWIADRFRPAVLVVQRDLRNVLASWLDLGYTGPRPQLFARVQREAARRWGIDLSVPDDAFARTAAMCGVMTVALHNDARAHNWVVLAHEEACADPGGQIRAAAAATGLVWTEAASEFLTASDRPGTGYSTQRVASEIPDGWRTRLTPAQLEVIELVTALFPPGLRAAALKD